MGLKVKGERGTIDLGNEELKAQANEWPTLTPIIMSTHSFKTQNKNTPFNELTIRNEYIRIHPCQTLLFTTFFGFFQFFQFFFSFFSLETFALFFHLSCFLPFFSLFFFQKENEWMTYTKAIQLNFQMITMIHPNINQNQPPKS